MISQLTSTSLGPDFISSVDGIITSFPTTLQYTEDGKAQALLKFRLPKVLDVDKRYCLNLQFNNSLDSSINPLRVYLSNDDILAPEKQTLGIYLDVINQETKQLIFQPKYNSFKSIVFEINKGIPINIQNRQFIVTINNFINVVNKLEKFSIDKNVFGSIGIQGPPGMTFILNDEGLQIGRSGVFEAQIADLQIDFIGFLPQERDVFLVDYNSNTP